MIKKGRTTGLYHNAVGPASDPIPQVDHHATITSTLDGKLLEMRTDAAHACSFISMKLDGVELIDAAGHGRGIQFAHNILRTGGHVRFNEWSPTEQGTQYDGHSPATGSSNNLYAAISSDGKRMVRRTVPAFWQKPNQETVPRRPGLSDRLVSQMENTIDTQLGWGGDEHVISFLTDVVVPDEPYVHSAQILDCVSCSVYANDAIFTVLEYLNPATGATRAYPGFPHTSQKEIVIASASDGSLAIATYQPLREWGATGYAQEHSNRAGSNDLFIRAREVGLTVKPGKRLYNAFLVLASRDQLIASVMALDAANITRSDEIALPGLA